jgi:two-component system, NarL family, nitrate/nitrite response regulator NarL
MPSLTEAATRETVHAPPAAVRILVIDDHTLFRRGVRALLAQEQGFQVVGDAADPVEGAKLAAQVNPDVILLDLHMPGITGVEAIPALREAAPCARIVMLTVSEDADDLMACLRAGASGYLLKNIDGEYLVDSIRRAARGESTMSAQMTSKLIAELHAASRVPSDPRKPPLSPRESEILCLVATGSSNKEVARALGVAESTVKIHVQHILRKLGLSSRVQAAVYAAEHGLVPRST